MSCMSAPHNRGLESKSELLFFLKLMRIRLFRAVNKIKVVIRSVWGGGSEEVEKLQKERDGRDYLIGTTDSSVS